MMKRFLFNDGSARQQSRAGLAFTLVEMLVALGVLVVAMAVVTNIFGISAKTAAQAQAIGQVEAALDSFVRQMRADLDGIDPSRSVLVINGRMQPAARTEELRQAGQYWRVLTGDPTRAGPAYDPRYDGSQSAYPPGTSARDQYSDPRGDVLMFFTQRPLESRAPATDTNPGNLTAFQAALQRGAKVAPAQIVYGLASFTDVTVNGTTYTWSNATRHIGYSGNTYRISQFPLTEWTLARRQVLIEDVSDGVSRNGQGVPTETVPRFNANAADWLRLLRNYAEAPGTRLTTAADSVQFQFRDWLEFYGPNPRANLRVGFPPYPQRLENYYVSPALGSPYNPAAWSNAAFGGAGLYPGVLGLLYNPTDPAAATFYHVATLARNVPPEIQSNQALVALRACAWFQVEFLMPEDPRNSVETPLSSQRDDMPRWVEVPPQQTYVFVPDSAENRDLIKGHVNPANGVPASLIGFPTPPRLATFGQVVPPGSPSYGGANTGANRKVRIWPYAIRITVRAFDRDGKLNEPIVRTVVHRFE